MTDYKNDIDRYLRGELTPAEMNALEKRALEDPFLADALEGAQQLPAGDFMSDLNDLQHSLNKRIQKKNIGWVWLGRIAAGLLLLAISTYLIVLISDRRGEKASENLALNKSQELSPATPSPNGALSSPDSITVMDETVSSAESPQAEEGAEVKAAPETTIQKDQSTDAVPSDRSDADANAGARREQQEERLQLSEAEHIPETSQPAKKMEEPEQKDSPPVIVESGEDKNKGDVSDDEKSKELTSRAKSAAPAGAASNSYNVTRKVIRGKVTFAEDGMGLPGVNVLVRGSNEGTVTDSQGNYEIAVEEQHPTLLFSFIGFTNKELYVESERVDVQLDADVSELSEIVVVGYGSEKKESTSLPVMELAAPAGGRKAFKQYLESNLHYPEQALKNEVEGKVTVQFTIGMTGQLSNFTVIRGIGHGCDEEVIRLIKAGPKWSPTKKNEEPIKDRVRVRMRFALPKK